MKFRIFILLIVVQINLSLYLSAQELPINSRFKGGSEGFYRFMTENLKYPVESVNSKTIGYSITGITITPEGEIKEISAINPLDEYIDNEVKAVLEKSKNKWTRSKSITTDQTFYVQVIYTMVYISSHATGANYQVRDAYNFLEPVCLAAARQNREDLPTKNDSIKTKLTEVLKKAKYEEAKKYADELIRRDPFNTKIYQLRIFINRKLENNDLVTKDAQRLQNFIPGVTLDELLGTFSQLSAKNDSIAKVRNSKDVVRGINSDTTVQMPEFPGGLEALMRFIDSNLQYPVSASKGGIQGMVLVGFFVNKYGRVNAPFILKSADPYLDEEAKRVIHMMPLWKPGRKNGEAVNVFYSLPVRFSLRTQIINEQRIRMGN